jgi:hypothetical protein
MPPLVHGFGHYFRETKIDGAGEELLSPIHPSRRQQFLRPDHAQRAALLGTDQVLATFTARDREISRPHVATTGKVRQHVGTFVVRVGCDHQQGAGLIQFAE